MNEKYRLSGKSGNLFLLGSFIGPILITLLCVVYSYINVYNPIVYLTLLVFLGLLFGIMMVQKLVIKLSKCRSEKSSMLYGIIVGLFGVYASWCTFFFVLFQRDALSVNFIDIVLNPGMIYEFARSLAKEGYYSLLGIQVKGGLLWFIWIVESLGIIAAGALGGFAMMHKEIFCEHCNRWAEDMDFDLRLAIEDRMETQKVIETDISKILDYSIYEGENLEHLKINLHHCSRCQNTSTVDVNLISYEANDKGEIKEKSEDFSPVITLNSSQFFEFINKNPNYGGA